MTTYHHGDLPNELRRAAAEVITEKGIGNFSLREVARRAGVSHAAPAHHFGDTTGLLTSLATEAFTHLAANSAAAAAEHEDPIDRLTAMGQAYVALGIQHPAHCQVMFRADLVDSTDPDYANSAAEAYAFLEQTVEDVATAINPDLDIDHAGKLCWAAMQGLVMLHENMANLDGDNGRATAEVQDLVVSFTNLMVEGFRSR
ncbi:MAG: TetR/AcrR family transcriptional regulator [Acidimicrobiales bacterium]